MTIQIGRAGRDSALTLRSPATWSWAGDEADIRGTLDATSYVNLVLLRNQVNGLIGNDDEPVVNVNWTGDPTVDGYYETLDGGVPMPARGIAALKLDYQLRLRRLAVYPIIESLLSGSAVRPNAHSITKSSTVPWWATPTAAAMDHAIGGDTPTTRASETGNLKIQYTDDGTVFYDTVRRWRCPASDYQAGAARVEVFDGSTWRTHVGVRLPNTSALAGWRINNGLIRLSYGGGDGLLKVEWYLSGAWINAKTFKLTYDKTSVFTLGAFQTVTVLRNTPEACTIRLGLERSTSFPVATSVDLTLRRGALWVEGVTVQDPSAGAFEFGIYSNSAVACTAHTAGVHQTTADASGAAGGGKFYLNTSLAKTNDLTNGGFSTSASVSVFDWQLGYEPPAAAGPDTFTNGTYAYFAPVDETVGFARP